MLLAQDFPGERLEFWTEYGISPSISSKASSCVVGTYETHRHRQLAHNKTKTLPSMVTFRGAFSVLAEPNAHSQID